MRTLDASTTAFPSSQEYRKALSAIRNQITVNQLLMLQRHYHAPGRAITSRQLAKALGLTSYNVVKSQYGTLAHRVCDALDVDVNSVWLFILATWTKDRDVADGELLLLMRPQVAHALEALKWVW
jgi:hypothetical protein